LQGIDRETKWCACAYTGD